MKVNSTGVNTQDFEILSIVASQPKVSSWTICKKLFPDEANPKNHLSPVIWRLNKLTRMKFLKRERHPTRKKKVVYSLPDLAFSVDGTVFIPSPIGGVIINCTYINDCKPHLRCKFGSPKCRLASAIHKQGLEPVLKIAEVLTKMRDGGKEQNKEERQWETPLVT